MIPKNSLQIISNQDKKKEISFMMSDKNGILADAVLI